MGPSLEALQHQLLESQRAQQQLLQENGELKRQLAQGEAPASQPPPGAPLDTTLAYLQGCPLHASLGLPVIDPMHYMEWCKGNAVASLALICQPVSWDCTRADLAQVLSGEVFADDGPFQGGRMQVMSQPHLDNMELEAEAAARMRAHVMKTNIAMHHTHKGKPLMDLSVINGSHAFSCIIASWRQGELRPILLRHVVYHKDRPTSYFMGCFMPVIAQMAIQPSVASGPPAPTATGLICQTLSSGTPHFCMLMHSEPDHDMGDPRIRAGAIQDYMALANVPAKVTLCCLQGRILSQNAASMARIGVHGTDQLLTQLPAGSVPAYSQGPDINYLLELFGSQESLDAALQTVARDGTFRQRIRVVSATLLSWMQLRTHDTVYHEVSISKLKDGVTGQMTYIVAELDVTDVVQAERRVQRLQNQQRALLKKILPLQVIDMLLEERKRTIENAVEPPRRSVVPKNKSVILGAPEGTSGSSNTTHEGAVDSQHTTGTCSKSLELLQGPGEVLDAPSPFSRATYAQSDDGGPVECHCNARAARAVRFADAEANVGGPLQQIAEISGRASQRTSEQSHATSVSGVARPLQLSSADVQELSHFHNEVTILFTDIQGFTSMSQSLHPSQVMLFLNELFSAFDALLEEYDVYKVETIGDCYMVCAGLFDRTSSRRASTVNDEDADVFQPANTLTSTAASIHQTPDTTDLVQHRGELGGYDPHHANKMLSFAKAMLSTANSITNPLGAPVRMRVGVHSGPIMTGVVGRKMPRFCCFGDTVNTASRMESTGTAGAIHASAAFQALTPDERWLPTGGVEVKGKGHMDTYIMHYDPLWELEEGLLDSHYHF